MIKKKILCFLVSYRDPQKLSLVLKTQSRMTVPDSYEPQLLVFDNSEKPDMVAELERLCALLLRQGLTHMSWMRP